MRPAAVTDEQLQAEPDRWLLVGDVVLDLAGVVVYVRNARIPLTYREFLVLRALMVRVGRVVTRAELLADVWGDRRPRTRMVDVYVRRVRSRLGDRVTGESRAPSLEHHIRAVRGQGYVFDVPDPSASDDAIPQPRPSTGS